LSVHVTKIDGSPASFAAVPEVIDIRTSHAFVMCFCCSKMKTWWRLLRMRASSMPKSRSKSAYIPSSRRA
jgi:hypothetical protein